MRNIEEILDICYSQTFMNKEDDLRKMIAKKLCIDYEDFKEQLNAFVLHCAALFCSEPNFWNMIYCFSIKYPYFDIMFLDEYTEEPNEIVISASKFKHKHSRFNVDCLDSGLQNYFILKSFCNLLEIEFPFE